MRIPLEIFFICYPNTKDMRLRKILAFLDVFGHLEILATAPTSLLSNPSNFHQSSTFNTSEQNSFMLLSSSQNIFVYSGNSRKNLQTINIQKRGKHFRVEATLSDWRPYRNKTPYFPPWIYILLVSCIIFFNK